MKQRYSSRVVKFASQVLAALWVHQELRDAYKKTGWKVWLLFIDSYTDGIIDRFDLVQIRIEIIKENLLPIYHSNPTW